MGETRLDTDGDPVTLYDSGFEYDAALDSDFAGVVETAAVNVGRILTVWVSVRISVRVPVDVTEGVAVFVLN